MDNVEFMKHRNDKAFGCPYSVHLIRMVDMPAHLKSSILGSSLNIPVTNGDLNLGIWQGIYLCEHRNHGGARSIVLTLQGE
jgi:secondary thiamine-phosphate synthase enzyme